ncbi:uncharacterized protein N7459_002051 [Penicillium hispanicum]|uniref:uncharacterized protein n=1 Tax=Penicillium hispanicum TaxID=1080232 RepID=UPI0025404D4C|nr:uncharacterized protein N7459_002051 [Penicillium hispanicum]KAJ5591682.1 hypothetical protein N7459_002051 [Penicillium hispanicum]
MSRMPPPGEHHMPPHGAHGVYDHAWHSPYPPSAYDAHTPDSRRPSVVSQGPLPPQGYPVMPNRELPQLPPDGPYGRPSSMPGPPHPIADPNPPPLHASYRPAMNGTTHELSPHSAPPDYRSRMAFQPSEPPPSEPTPTSGPLPPTTQFMSPQPPPQTSTSGPYDTSYHQNPAYGARNQQRKAARATQACDQCRARKAKCDEGRPACSHCKENHLICVYKEVPPHKQEKSAQVILDRLMELEDKLCGRIENVEKLQTTQGAILEQLMLERSNDTLRASRIRTSAPIAPPAAPPEPIFKAEPPAVVSEPDEPDEKSPFQGQPVQARSLTTQPLPAPQLPVQSLPDGMAVGFEDLAMKNDNEGELSIPVEHTTAAHKLLMWPSIKRLLYPHEYDEDYVMRLEEERGLISVFGQGEISQSADDTQLPMTPPMRDGASYDEKRIDGDGTYQGQGLPSPEAEAEIDRYGLLRLDAKTARRYYQSYLERIHKLHPFMDQNELSRNLEVFIRCYCPRSSSPTDPPNTLCRENSRGAKRKRSLDELQGVRGGSVDPASASSRPRVGRNIENAVVLLIFALGAICETKSPLPGPIMNEKVDYRRQHIPGPLPPLPSQQPANGTHAAHGVLSPANSDSALPISTSFYPTPIHSMSQSFPLPHQSSTHSLPSSAIQPRKSFSRRTISKDEFGNVQNLQVIPGLALYGYATGILGYLQGGIELEHVQAALLAGLYAGQLAHPFQSHGWICQAARACQVLVRKRRYERLEEGPTQDLYNFAYWTCLQLESDLLAELDIPASGISRSEGRMALPKGRYTIALPDDFTAPSTMMMLFYSAQIHLRKVLNRVHTDLYKVEKQGQTRWSSNVQEALSMNLDLWRTSLPDIMKWKDSDDPSSDINAARMRAKYYGARYIIHRPLLYHALHYGQTGARVGSVGQSSVDSPTGLTNGSQPQHMSPSMSHTAYRAPNMSRIYSDLGSTPSNSSSSFPNGWVPPTVHLRELPQKLRRACKVCIESAILSTEAFDGIGDRLVVTNIFGTAHAQFGNMLVLSATYMSSLSELVERNTLERLLRRTIKFLLNSENISPTLRADARILEEIYIKIFGHQPDLT